MLHIDERFYPTLFDFNEPWKIDILEFMEQNYMYDFSMEDLATFTGRSLATFKRDFKKISTLTPQKWLIHKRLEAAYEKMKTGTRKVQDVYLEVGFKNPSHFATAFKKAIRRLSYRYLPINFRAKLFRTEFPTVGDCSVIIPCPCLPTCREEE